MSRSKVYWIRKSHRYLGIIIGVQLLLWTVSGLYFSWTSIETVRGEDLRRPPPPVDLGGQAYAPPHVAIERLAARRPEIERVSAVSMRVVLGQPVYEIEYRVAGKPGHVLADARTGELRPPLTEDEAVAVARADFAAAAEIAGVARITEKAPGSEYRGSALPVVRVTFAHDSGTRVYVSEDRGMVTARRNDRWRLFDFLWMLHILDVDEREDFNNLALQILSALGVITVLSGFVLWGATSPLFRRRRRP